MAVSDAIQKLAYARFLRPYVQENIWMGFVQDYSAEIAAGGKTVVIPVDKGAGTDRSRTAGAGNYKPLAANSFDEDIGGPDNANVGNAVSATNPGTRWPASTGQDIDTVELGLDEIRVINKRVTTIQERRVIPSLVASRAENAAREMLEEVNANIRAKFLAGPQPGTGTFARSHTLPTISAANFAKGINDSANAAFKTALLDEFGDAQLAASVNYWPAGGRVAVVSPRIHKYLTDALQAEKLYLVNDNPQYVREGTVMRYKGWDIIEDNSAGDGTANSDDDKHAIFYLQRGVGLGYLGELRDLTVIRSEIEMASLLQGVFSWGCEVIEPKKLALTKLNIS